MLLRGYHQREEVCQGLSSGRNGLRLISCCGLLWLVSLLLLMTACSNLDFLQEQHDLRRPTDQQVELKDPSESLQRIVRLIEKDEPERLLNEVHPYALEDFGRSQIVDRCQKLHRELGVRSIKYEDIHEIQSPNNPADQKFYSLKAVYVTDYGTLEREQSLTLRWRPDQQTWALMWHPGIILPGLAREDRLRIEVLPAARGLIVDRNNKALACPGELRQIAVIPGHFDRAEGVKAIAKAFPISEERLQYLLNQSWVRDYTLVPLLTVRKLNDEQRAVVSRFKLQVDSVATRDYPYGEALAPLLGWVAEATADDLAADPELKAGDVVGRAGLERLLEKNLRGQRGFIVRIEGAYPQVLFERKAVDGKNIHLTIDAELQKQIYSICKAEKMAITALNPQNGELLALVSCPSYDPRLFMDGISQKAYNELLNNPKEPLVNKALTLFTPGSTAKVLTAIAGITEKGFDPRAKRPIHGKSWQPGPAWGGYAVHRYTVLNKDFDLAAALVSSDNIYFAQVALEMGGAKFMAGLRKLGVGEESIAGYSGLRSQWSNGNAPLADGSILLADTAYGQGQMLMSQTQILLAYAALYNGGKVLEAQLYDAKGPLQRSQEAILSEKDRVYLQKALRSVVTETYANIFKDKGVEIAGKSGTAEIGVNDKNEARVISSFVGLDLHHPDCLLMLSHFDAQTAPKFEGFRFFVKILKWRAERLSKK